MWTEPGYMMESHTYAMGPGAEGKQSAPGSGPQRPVTHRACHSNATLIETLFSLSFCSMSVKLEGKLYFIYHFANLTYNF